MSTIKNKSGSYEWIIPDWVNKKEEYDHMFEDITKEKKMPYLKKKTDHITKNISDIAKKLKEISKILKDAKNNISKEKKNASEEKQVTMDEVDYILDDIDTFIDGIIPAVDNAKDMTDQVCKADVNEDEDEEKPKVNEEPYINEDILEKMREILNKEKKQDQIKITGEKSKYWENTSWNGGWNLKDSLKKQYKNTKI